MDKGLDRSANFRTKKHLGQHFLKEKSIALKIVDLLPKDSDKKVIEIGPGKGVLTQLLLAEYPHLQMVEVDTEAVDYLHKELGIARSKIIPIDILKWDIPDDFPVDSFFIGNLPYNISSPIFFKLLDHISLMQRGVFMIQKEVAERICANHGNKTYGILSVLIGAYYERNYAFTVPPGAFNPPPKVKSGVISLQRKEELPELAFRSLKRVVKAAFNQRRKTLRNALKSLDFSSFDDKDELFSLRAEQLSIEKFILLSQHLKPFKP